MLKRERDRAETWNKDVSECAKERLQELKVQFQVDFIILIETFCFGIRTNLKEELSGLRRATKSLNIQLGNSDRDLKFSEEKLKSLRKKVSTFVFY